MKIISFEKACEILRMPSKAAAEIVAEIPDTKDPIDMTANEILDFVETHRPDAVDIVVLVLGNDDKLELITNTEEAYTNWMLDRAKKIMLERDD